MLSLRRQCDLLGLHRSGVFYAPREESELNLELMRLIDEEFMRHPFLGSRKMTDYLCRRGYEVNRKRIRRLMRLMGLEAVYPKPRLSKAHPEHRKYPYLLRDLEIVRPNQVWATDITYVPMRHGFLYLIAIMDWFSRFVLA